MNRMMGQIRAIERPALLTERIYDEVKRNIQNSHFKPGDVIREVDLCESFNVSRTPVREALQRLQYEGLIEAQGVRGLVVATLTREDIEEIYQLRLILEVSAVNLACTAQDSSAKRQYLKEMANAIQSAALAVRSSNSEVFIEANREFRNAWLSMVPNERLKRSVRLYAGHVRALQSSTLVSLKRQKTVLDGMKAIQAAILSSDHAGAELAMRDYLSVAHNAMLELLEFSEITQTE